MGLRKTTGDSEAGKLRKELRYWFSADYDHILLKDAKKEMRRLKKKFPHITFHLFRSSRRAHYHVRSFDFLSWKEAYKILKFSKCSKGYKKHVKRRKSFDIRVGQKINYYRSGKIRISPAPVKIWTL